MWAMGCCLLAACVTIQRATGANHFHRSGRRICSSSAQAGVVTATHSFIQPVYHPLLTLCQGQRACSTYRTTYRITYREVSRTAAPQYRCCPGWRQLDARSQACDRGSCRSPCQHGGLCIGYSKCKCPAGWTGTLCQTDVDECALGRHRCAQSCVNTAGSFRCGCREGFSLVQDGRSCDKAEKPPPPPAAAGNGTGAPAAIREEMRELRNKIEVLEQKLQLVLAPFHSLATSSPEDTLGPITLLAHSFRQLDRIDSLSEQISFLEERLESCSCKNDL